MGSTRCQRSLSLTRMTTPDIALEPSTHRQW
jgi:hypothetical protein